MRSGSRPRRCRPLRQASTCCASGRTSPMSRSRPWSTRSWRPCGPAPSREERLREAAGRVAVASARLRALEAAASSASLRRRQRQRVGGTVRHHGRRPPRARLTGAQVLRFVSGANVAAGRVPWGLPADGRLLSPAPRPSTSSRARRCPTWTPDRPVVALVRGGHRYAWVLAGLTTLARRRPDLVVVELGWPGPDRLPGRTLVHTYGASAVSARALDDRLADAALAG